MLSDLCSVFVIKVADFGRVGYAVPVLYNTMSIVARLGCQDVSVQFNRLLGRTISI